MLNLRHLPLGFVLLALGVAGCASQDEEVDPIVTISNNWADEADPTHTFQFNSADDGERAGSFDRQRAIRRSGRLHSHRVLEQWHRRLSRSSGRSRSGTSRR